MPKQELFATPQQMKLLRDKALFSDSDYIKFKAIRELSEYGRDAIPIIVEIADTSNASLKKLCQETIARIELGI